MRKLKMVLAFTAIFLVLVLILLPQLKKEPAGHFTHIISAFVSSSSLLHEKQRVSSKDLLKLPGVAVKQRHTGDNSTVSPQAKSGPKQGGRDKRRKSHKPRLRPPSDNEKLLLAKAHMVAGKFTWEVNKSSVDVQEVRHVVFIKVHKAASTTLHNIFLRFSLSRQLNVLLPSYYNNILSVYSNTLSTLLPHPPSPPFLFDFLINHVVLNVSQLSVFFPPDTRYVAIVREPLQHLMSSYFYFGIMQNKTYLKNSTFDSYIRNQSAVETMSALRSLTNNRMSIDLGLPPKQVGNASFIAPFLRHLDRVLDVVLVVDRMEESLVLMKRQFRWTFKDILHRTLNEQTHNTHAHWDSEVMRRFRQFEQFDVALYKHYLHVLKRRISEETPDFAEEVETFVHINNQVLRFCDEKFQGPRLDIASTRWSSAFSVQQKECSIMIATELQSNSWAQLMQLKRLAPFMYE